MDDLFYNLAGLMNQIGLSGAADTLVRLIAAVPQPLAAGDDYTVELASLVEMVTVECSVR